MNELARATTVLTVAEAKRLIAVGIVEDERVKRAMNDGMVAVCKGTTNAYVLEELLGESIDRGKYVLGRTTPTGREAVSDVFEGEMPEVVFRNGEVVEGMAVSDGVAEMEANDVVLKGANALDYRNGLAALLIGHNEGGTAGSIVGHVYGKGLHFIIPIGLEKELGIPFAEYEPYWLGEEAELTGVPRLWPLLGDIFTEIEAIQTVADVYVQPIGSGGVCGAEGAVRLLVYGEQDEVEMAMEYVEKVQGEAAFGEQEQD